MSYTIPEIIAEIDSIAESLEDSPLYFQSRQIAEGITAMRQAAEKFAGATEDAARLDAALWVGEAYLLYSSSLPDAGIGEAATGWATATQIAKLIGGPALWETRVREEFGGSQ